MVQRCWKFFGILLCSILFITVSLANATSPIEVLVYTGKVAITDAGGETMVFNQPQEIPQILVNSKIETIEGVTILKTGQVQTVLEQGDKIHIVTDNNTTNLKVVCLVGKIKIMYGPEISEITPGQVIALNNDGSMQKVESQNLEGSKQIRGRIEGRPYTTSNKEITVNEPADLPIDRIDASPSF